MEANDTQAPETDETTDKTTEAPETEATETVETPSPEAPPAEAAISREEQDLAHHAEFLEHLDAMQGFDDGDVVTGTVVRIDRDEVLVDIGYKSEGVIPSRELSIQRDAKPEDVVQIGEEIDALVLQKEDKDGRLILSKKRAEYEKSWVGIEQKFKGGETVRGRVIEVVKGGLILDIGLRGFLPASLVDLRRVKDLDQFVGTELEAAVIEMDRNRNNVVLSRRKLLEEERRSERQEILAKLEKGMRLKGSVSSIVDFGAFVDLGGIDGLIHISELSWTHVAHPSEAVQVGQEVEVEVLDIDRDRERISLSLKKTQDDPWKQKVRELPIGGVINGRVTKLVPFGAFIELTPGVEGLAHISELAHEHVEVPEQVVKVGEQVYAKVMDIDLDRRRISLSLKQVDVVPADAEEGDELESAAAEPVEAEEVTAEVAEEAAAGQEAPAEAEAEPETEEATAKEAPAEAEAEPEAEQAAAEEPAEEPAEEEPAEELSSAGACEIPGEEAAQAAEVVAEEAAAVEEAPAEQEAPEEAEAETEAPAEEEAAAEAETEEATEEAVKE